MENRDDAGALPEGRLPEERTALLIRRARAELGRRIAGQGEMIDGLLLALIAGGHVLLEGAPGLAKTLAARSLAEITGLLFRRIQFTPDLLPADITGTLVWDQGAGAFSVRRGPVFANVILADEINRAPAKVQSALLEAMEEGQVTIGEHSHPLPNPFLVLATQNPIEHEGTYTLPQAQLDRFLLKILIRYPNMEEEIRILDLADASRNGLAPLDTVMDPPSLKELRAAAEAVHMDPRIAAYLVSVTAATRPGGGLGPSGESRSREEGLYRYISFGASPRASIALSRCSRVRALFEGRSFVTPEDVKAAAYPVLRHRIILSYEAEAEGLEADTIIGRILSNVPVP